MKIWDCKIGEVPEELLVDGADHPMRVAVAESYRKLTGQEPNFIFSGWGAKLSEAEEAVVGEYDPPLRNERPQNESR